MLCIFDVDGTLVNAYKAIQESLNFTRRKFGRPCVGIRIVKRKVGKGDRLFIREFFKPNDRAPALEVYRAHHKNALLRYSKLLPYTKTLLSKLKRKKIKLAVASNRPCLFTNAVLKRLGIQKYFDYILCADIINSLKPHPRILQVIMKRLKAKKEETVFIGDMAIDMETAKRAGVKAIFVKGGSGALKDVKRYRNIRKAANLKEIYSKVLSFSG